MSASYRLNVVSTARANVIVARAAFAAAEAAAYDSQGLVRDAAALQAFSRASDALADALFTFTRAWEWASSRE